jgi:hypothetical protein
MLLAAAGCSTSTLNGGLGEVCLEFTPLASCSTAQVVARQGAASTCAEVKVELVLPVAGGVTDVFGATFTLGYDPAETFFSSASEAGSLLGADGAPVIVNPPFSTTQPVSVVITRSGVTTGADPLATNELLITLSFVRLATSGSAELTLEDGELWSYGQPPVPKPGIAFCGGTLSIN